MKRYDIDCCKQLLTRSVDKTRLFWFINVEWSSQWTSLKHMMISKGLLVAQKWETGSWIKAVGKNEMFQSLMLESLKLESFHLRTEQSWKVSTEVWNFRCSWKVLADVGELKRFWNSSNLFILNLMWKSDNSWLIQYFEFRDKYSWTKVKSISILIFSLDYWIQVLRIYFELEFSELQNRNCVNCESDIMWFGVTKVGKLKITNLWDTL